MEEFKEFGKIARMSRNMVITEKIDGTNAQIYIKTLEGLPEDDLNCLVQKDGLAMFAGSRNRWITPEADNMGFARWAREHAEELFLLGEGRHFGEWWGRGIQKRYSQTETEKHFSLFNTKKWLTDFDNTKPLCPSCCRVVPVLYRGLFNTQKMQDIMDWLLLAGSAASTGCHNPEGVVIYHEARDCFFKKTYENDAGKWAEKEV